MKYKVQKYIEPIDQNIVMDFGSSKKSREQPISESIFEKGETHFRINI
jgi:hypothetical protein